MSSDIITLQPGEIESADTETLRAHLAQTLTITAQSLQYLSSIWQELERRGEDLSDLRGGIAVYLPKIAAGTLAAEAVVRYAGQRMLLRALAKLPLPEQRDLVKRGTIQRIETTDEGAPKSTSVSLHRLSSRDVALVFGDSAVRTTEEQFHLLQKKTGSKTRKNRYARQVRITEDGILVGGRLAKLDRVLDALSEHYAVDLVAAIKRAHGSSEEGG